MAADSCRNCHFSHSWWLGGYGPEPQPGGLKLGSWAVLGFFGISGYLISMSRLRARRSLDYASARFFRIFPGLAVCVAVVAFVFAPLTAAATGNAYSISGGLLFFITNLSAGTPGVAVAGIPGSLDGVHDPASWNGPVDALLGSCLLRPGRSCPEVSEASACPRCTVGAVRPRLRLSFYPRCGLGTGANPS
ncbi:acyltransferase family protein [Pseudarthrobacter enclensis]|uniref:acyltransferase family protein n=1 Tax=Pseudarthrobacter enclensis TaxID=993070 RepID=UPI00344A584C